MMNAVHSKEVRTFTPPGWGHEAPWILSSWSGLGEGEK